MFINWFATDTMVLTLAQGQEAQQPPPGGGIIQLVFMIGLVIVIFYFMYSLPTKKEKEKHDKMTKSLMKGDIVLTIGGIHGEVSKVNDQTIVLKTGEKTSKITVSKSSIKMKMNPNGE